MVESDFVDLCVYHVPDTLVESESLTRARASLPRNLLFKPSKEIPNVNVLQLLLEEMKHGLNFRPLGSTVETLFLEGRGLVL